MKTRESDMPKEEAWATLFDPPIVLKLLGVDSKVNDISEEFLCLIIESVNNSHLLGLKSPQFEILAMEL